MAIVPLQRITLIGELKRRAEVLQMLQDIGCVHVVELPSDGVGVAEDPVAAGALTRSAVKAAITYLQRCQEQHPPRSRSTGDADIDAIATAVLQIESEHRELAAERETLVEKIEQSRPWGQFIHPSPEELGGRRLFFYRLSHRQATTLSEIENASEVRVCVHQDSEHQYWLIIAAEVPGGMPTAPETLDPRPLEVLEDRLYDIDLQLEQLHRRRVALTAWANALRDRLIVIEDETALRIAIERSRVDGPLFMLQGWVPRRELARLKTFATEQAMVLCDRAPTHDDEPPTLLSNPRPVAGAEGAVTFFMTPAYRAWDPTWIMFLSFAVFFAMILADAGYGLVLAVILAFAAKPLGRTESTRRLRQLAVFMVLVTIVYGVLMGSYFGFAPPPGSSLNRLVIQSDGVSIMQDRETMMLLSATIGVFHLVLANVIVAWRWLGSGHALASVGWVLTLLGGWLLAVARVSEPDVMTWLSNQLGGHVDVWKSAAATAGWWMLGSGLAAVFLFSSTRPVFSSRPKNWLLRGVDGLIGLTGVTKAFGDSLSYLRLFALGLASAQLAIVFNQLAADASQVRGVGVLLGLLIFLIGHTLNLLLAVVGGVVHGLRLNCIEFFSWSLTDEGQPFEAFETRAKQ
jgi:V/A-type H+-transporting ATPase subunit I